MSDILDKLRAWSAHPTAIVVLLVVSGATLVATAVGVPWYVRRLPPDYFVRREDDHDASRSRSPQRLAIAVLRNVVGVILVLAGLALLVLPGQGIATLLAGVLITDFPGKKRIARRLLATRPVRRAIDGLRRRAGQPPLEL